MAPRYRVEYLDPHFENRFRRLPRPAQRRLLELLGEVANTNPLKGQPCGYQPSTGNLSDCRKLYFDVDREREPTYRMIYRVLPTEEKPAVIEVVTVGPKYDFGGSERGSIYARVGALLERICG